LGHGRESAWAIAIYPIDADDVIRSYVFPGLWLAINDLLTGIMTQILAVLQESLVSPEHGVFVQQVEKL
jgi:hypothetical protein